MKKTLIFIFLLFIIQCSTENKNVQLEKKWMIHPGGVGDIFVGKSLPKKFNSDTNLNAKYFYTHIADGIVFEGFKINKPHILVGIKDGPFSKWEENNGSAKPGIILNKMAVEAARKGALVKMIIINSKKYRTKRHIGVGSTYVELKKAYPDLKRNKVPPTMGEDLCASYTQELSKVYFYFKSCKDADNNGKISRVMVF